MLKEMNSFQCFVIILIFTVIEGYTFEKSWSFSASITYRDVIFTEWSLFKATYGKSYSNPTEEKFRLKVFMENKQRIAQHNKRAANGEETFTMGMNQFGDMMTHEITERMNGYKVSDILDNDGGTTFLEPENFQIPPSIDWRKKGFVTGVKDQKMCGSCWAFSATGSLEGQHFRKTQKLVSLSEQNLVDCSQKYGNEGCSGGLMTQAFDYVKANKGIDTEKSYPYKGEDEKCRFSRANIGATCTGYVCIPSGNELKLASAVATVGPVSVAIDASQSSFQFYKKGIYNEPDCGSQKGDLDHGVLAVGYGAVNNTQYWIVKNSWGVSWGMEGYILMSRNKGNQCGIATMASYPLV